MADAVWERIVASALAEGVDVSKGPVPGARLRHLVARQAQAAGLSFPPDPTKTFSSFLDEFPGVLLAQRRPGRDMLVVPADNVGLLSTPAANSIAPMLRRDLFEALTLIPREGVATPFYLRASDKVIWAEPGTAVADDAIPFPAISLDDAIAERKAFSSQAPTPDAREALERSLLDSKPLRTFTEVLRRQGLLHGWHQFRLGRMLERLRSWSAANEIDWRSEWLPSDERAVENTLGTATAGTRLETAQAFLTALSLVLREEDLARVSIPLDLVARTWPTRS
jgi:hypothetical protein